MIGEKKKVEVWETEKEEWNEGMKFKQKSDVLAEKTSGNLKGGKQSPNPIAVAQGGTECFQISPWVTTEPNRPFTMPLPHIHAPRDYSHITKIPYCIVPPSYDEFLETYLEPNIPVLIGPALTQPWRARQEWVTSEGKPDFDRLRSQLCTQPVQVPVADCQSKDFSDQKRSTMDFKDFLDEWQAQSEAHQPARTYLKDFHFVRSFPDYGAYETPDIFRDDWMNEFWTRRGDMDDDYRFVYCGGDGTFTPFHADVYRYGILVPQTRKYVQNVSVLNCYRVDYILLLVLAK